MGQASFTFTPDVGGSAYFPIAVWGLVNKDIFFMLFSCIALTLSSCQESEKI